MSNICVYFEAQGFFLNNRFEPREIALLSASATIHSAVNHCLEEEDIPADCVWAVKEMQDHHGLSFQPSDNDMSISHLQALILRFYNANRNADKFLIAYSTDGAEKILRTVGIPRIKIPIHSLDEISICHLHPSHGNYHCALGYAQRMFLENLTD